MTGIKERGWRMKIRKKLFPTEIQRAGHPYNDRGVLPSGSPVTTHTQRMSGLLRPSGTFTSLLQANIYQGVSYTYYWSFTNVMYAVN
jgi:hypothetical protein